MASLFGGSNATRPLILHSSSTRVSVPVPASPLSTWIASETLAQEFHDSRVGLDEPEPATEVEEGAIQTPASNEPQVKLLARFLSFVADRVDQDNAEVLLAAYDRFNELFLSVVNVHSLVQSFEPETRAEVLSAYFRAFAAGRDVLGNKVKLAHTSALIESAKKGESSMYALFGGQGVNEVSAVLYLFCARQLMI